ncbi:MAG: Crp/Fnr family transcriptional regulator [Bacteroidetes bacterium]|nr:Crp/Fnr family transcriptional regulator [Bacteroidota bacterium]
MSEIRELLRKHFPNLNDPQLLDEFDQSAQIKEIPAGQAIMNFGQHIREIPLLVSGLLKVYREDDDGNELFLYHINAGQSCAISFVCSFSDRISQIRAETVENSVFITIPIEKMDSWMRDYKSWYYYVLATYRERFEEMLKTIDSIAFHKMDERVLEYLKRHSKVRGTMKLQMTHQDIAYELNTSREVISRLLKKLEQNGYLKLGRNEIEMLE